jgi:hypothetical protein
MILTRMGDRASAANPKSEQDELSTEQRRRILAALESAKKQGSWQWR